MTTHESCWSQFLCFHLDLLYLPTSSSSGFLPVISLGFSLSVAVLFVWRWKRPQSFNDFHNSLEDPSLHLSPSFLPSFLVPSNPAPPLCRLSAKQLQQSAASVLGNTGAQFNRKKIAPKMAPKPNFEKETCMNCHFRHFFNSKNGCRFRCHFRCDFRCDFFSIELGPSTTDRKRQQREQSNSNKG